MKNIITASIHFSFKGKRHTPSITIELDKYISTTGALPNLCQLIAKENNFDMYSYEYEMMQAEPIKFSNAQGLITHFINDDSLDIEAFYTAWNENNILNTLQDIAKEHMQIDDLKAQPELSQALLQAYLAGKKSSE
ncbi:MAG: hypothetical protein OQK75_03920 [Gammaproteobacteria bacterium]|nr:hypothetical protein [Gammaproteobacteria bacterium]MCW8986796.1 hypothetical protein [Gammaproteobacteria bacterium]